MKKSRLHFAIAGEISSFRYFSLNTEVLYELEMNYKTAAQLSTWLAVLVPPCVEFGCWRNLICCSVHSWPVNPVGFIFHRTLDITVVNFNKCVTKAPGLFLLHIFLRKIPRLNMVILQIARRAFGRFYSRNINKESIPKPLSWQKW